MDHIVLDRAEMKVKPDSVITAIFLVCALVTTGAIIHREFLASPTGRAQVEQKPLFIKDWRAHLATGVRLGPTEVPVELLEFADFECPFCGTFYKNLKNVRGRYLRQVAITYIHFPLPGHRFAEPAARVAECAGDQGRFEPMYDELFEHQDDFGLKPWSEMATAAGVPDIAAFDSCIKSTAMLPRIEAGKELGKKLGIQGTPTIIINGWKLGRPPSADELDAMVKAVLAGRSPVTPDGKFAR